MIQVGYFQLLDEQLLGRLGCRLGWGARHRSAFLRILHFRRTRDAVLMALGMAILANSRPLEGFIFCIPVMVVPRRVAVPRRRDIASERLVPSAHFAFSARDALLRDFHRLLQLAEELAIPL